MNSTDYFGPNLGENVTEQPHEYCRYRAYRSPPDSEEPYEINKTWLHVFAARLAFVAVFEVRTINSKDFLTLLRNRTIFVSNIYFHVYKI